MRTTPAPGPTEAHGRLRRLLFLVPYVSKHQGQPVPEVAQAMGITPSELLEDLELLTLVGRPPFQPDDYVDIYVEDDKVFVDLDQRLSAPPRLTAAEGVALAAAAALLKAAASEALASALQKLERVLPTHAVQPFREMGKQLDVALEAPGGFDLLSKAIVERREVEFDYFSAGRGQTERRRAQPWELLSHRGQWYLAAQCLTRQDERLFRLDRVANIAVTDARFTPPDDVTPKGITAGDEALATVRVRFEAKVAPYVRERFGGAVTELPGGQIEVRVPGDSERWLVQWVSSFGGDAVVVEPEWARRAVEEAARALLR